MKAQAVLAAALFLIFAPSPEPKTLSEMSHGFLSYSNYEKLIALNTKSHEPIAVQPPS